MGNKLYRIKYIREVLLKNGTILKYKGNYSNWCYGVPTVETRESKEWLDLLSELNYNSDFKGHIDRKKRVWVAVDYHKKHLEWDRKKVFIEDFVSVKVSFEVDYTELKNIRMKRLVDELSAEDFILFLKDNEISCFPV